VALRRELRDPRRGSVLTWLLTIARNVAVDRLRLKHPEPVDAELLEAKLRLADSRDEHAGVDERDELRRALATLPDEQRRALLLASYFGRTAAEIAEAEAIPLGTAKTRIRTAMQRLRTGLEVSDG
jgi:RNA polymerase sigma-70 factor (ECF subfamily)